MENVEVMIEGKKFTYEEFLNLSKEEKNGHEIKIGKDCILGLHTKLVLMLKGKDCIYEFGNNVHVKSGYMLINGVGNTIKIGEGTEIEEALFFSNEYKNIIIGSNCLISFRVTLRTSDIHTIFDKKTKQRTNQAGEVIIKDKVWIGPDTAVLKGVTIERGNIIGMKSVVTKSILEQDCIYAGTPAKKVKDNILWDKRMLNEFPMDLI